MLTVDGGECVWRWVAPGLSSRRKPDRGLLPPIDPRGNGRPALLCRAGEDVGEMESVHLPKPL